MIDEIKEKKTYTQQDVVGWLRVGKRTMTKLVKAGKLNPTKIGRRYLYLGEDLLRFLRNK